MDWLYLRVAQMPRCSDLAIFVMKDRQMDGQMDKTNYFTPAHARGVIKIIKGNIQK
jgi:hypothetical protein